MTTILDEIASFARERTATAKTSIPAEEMRHRAEALPDAGRAFEHALSRPGLSFICECKKASPSKGVIEPNYRYLDIAREYERAGADCISVLTEPRWFKGSGEHLAEISSAVSIPCLRKDFIVDDYMIYEARVLGASAVLLICAILPEETLARYIETADRLGISSLVEVHDESEIDKALRCGARVIGVNNRNLKDFTVDTENSRRLRTMIPSDVIFVSESGVKNADDMRMLLDIGADAVLIGEAMMRAEDKCAKLAELRGGQ